MRSLTCPICSHQAYPRSFAQARRLWRRGLGRALDRVFTQFGFCSNCGILFRSPKLSVLGRELLTHFGYGKKDIGLSIGKSRRSRRSVDLPITIHNAFVSTSAKEHPSVINQGAPRTSKLSFELEQGSDGIDLHLSMQNNPTDIPEHARQQFRLSLPQESENIVYSGGNRHRKTRKTRRPLRFRNKLGTLDK